MITFGFPKLDETWWTPANHRLRKPRLLIFAWPLPNRAWVCLEEGVMCGTVEALRTPLVEGSKLFHANSRNKSKGMIYFFQNWFEDLWRKVYLEGLVSPWMDDRWSLLHTFNVAGVRWIYHTSHSGFESNVYVRQVSVNNILYNLEDTLGPLSCMPLRNLGSVKTISFTNKTTFFLAGGFKNGYFVHAHLGWWCPLTSISFRFIQEIETTDRPIVDL